MGRRKTVSDDDVLAAARRVFSERGHAASTREIARAAAVSEAVLYQRFATKDALFFAAMAPAPPDVAAILGPRAPTADPGAWLRRAVDRMADYFAEVLPPAIQVMLHPGFDLATGGAAAAAATDELEAELARRLRALRKRRQIAVTSPAAAARLLVSLAHDWALHDVLSGGERDPGRRLLAATVAAAWRGLAPGAAGGQRPRQATARRRPPRSRP